MCFWAALVELEPPHSSSCALAKPRTQPSFPPSPAEGPSESVGGVAPHAPRFAPGGPPWQRAFLEVLGRNLCLSLSLSLHLSCLLAVRMTLKGAAPRGTRNRPVRCDASVILWGATDLDFISLSACLDSAEQVTGLTTRSHVILKPQCETIAYGFVGSPCLCQSADTKPLPAQSGTM